jgi:MATE family, multidrug efflux pump
VISTGILRGLGNTHTPMLWNLVGHWLIGLPLGYTLCFHVGLGAVGLWIGLSSGLIVIGAGLMFVWIRKLSAMRSARPAGGV